MRVTIEVTAELINPPEQRSCITGFNCPIARALTRAGVEAAPGYELFINDLDLQAITVDRYGSEKWTTVAWWPEEATAFIEAHDERLQVKPLTFEVEIPDHAGVQLTKVTAA